MHTMESERFSRKRYINSEKKDIGERDTFIQRQRDIEEKDTYIQRQRDIGERDTYCDRDI